MKENDESTSVIWPHQVKRLCVASGRLDFRACNLKFADEDVGLLMEDCCSMDGLCLA